MAIRNLDGVALEDVSGQCASEIVGARTRTHDHTVACGFGSEGPRASVAPTDETVGLGTTGLGNCFVATCVVSAKFFRHGSGGNGTSLPPWRLLGLAAAACSPPRVYSTRVQRTASESDLVVTTKVCSIRIERAALGKRAPPRTTCGGPCRQARRHSVTQRGEKSRQRKRMRLRRVLANPRLLELSTSSAPAIPCGCNCWASIHIHVTSICLRPVVS